MTACSHVSGSNLQIPFRFDIVTCSTSTSYQVFQHGRSLMSETSLTCITMYLLGYAKLGRQWLLFKSECSKCSQHSKFHISTVCSYKLSNFPSVIVCHFSCAMGGILRSSYSQLLHFETIHLFAFVLPVLNPTTDYHDLVKFTLYCRFYVRRKRWLISYCDCINCGNWIMIMIWCWCYLRDGYSSR